MYTVKVIKRDETGDLTQALHSATHVVINKKAGEIEICNVGKASVTVQVPRDAEIVYVVSDTTRNTMATLRSPSESPAEVEAEKEKATVMTMTMHTTRMPNEPAPTPTSDIYSNDDTTISGEETTTHA